MRKLLTMPMKMRGLCGLIGLLVGIGCLVPEIYFWIRSCFNKPGAAADADAQEDGDDAEKAALNT